MHVFIETQKEWLRNVPAFRPGDTLRVNVRVKEGEKERIQAFEGICIARRGSGVSETFTVRKISNGNYLVAHESDGAVREYASDGKIVWEYEVPLFGKQQKPGHGPEAFGNSVFSALRLANGNTLIGAGNGHSVLEVTPDKQIVWKVEQNDLSGITLAWVTRVERLANGNTLIGNCHAGPENPQIIEITAGKKVVWTFKDFKNFGNSMPVQMVLP